ncbi:unnamed protein product [Lepidochelys olivacea]
MRRKQEPGREGVERQEDSQLGSSPSLLAKTALFQPWKGSMGPQNTRVGSMFALMQKSWSQKEFLMCLGVRSSEATKAGREP